MNSALRLTVASGLACALVLAVPALLVEFPVVTDLPQHLSQVRMFLDTVRNPDAPYTIQWATPYLFGYLLPLFAWLVSGPLWVGQLTLALCGGFWSAAVHTLAWRLRRGAAAAVLACAPFFGASLQWGFLSFSLGFAVFAAYLLSVERAFESPARRTRWLWPVVASVALYATHLLWFGAGLVTLTLLGAQRRAWRELCVSTLAHVPVLALAARSTLFIHDTFTNSTVWAPLPWLRLWPGWWASAALGSARDGVPLLLFLGLVGWLAVGAWQHWREPGAFSRPLVTVAAVFTAFALLLPSRYTNTIQFETRWASPALALWALAVPGARVRFAGVLAAAMLTLSSADLSLAWWNVNEDELSGLNESLAALPDGARVLGLSFVKQSRYVEGAPFLQTFAWAQVRHGGALNFSFADFSIMPVVFTTPRRGWTTGLEWYPERVQDRDFAHFDFVLVSGAEPLHARAGAHPLLRPVTSRGVWRLYETHAGTGGTP